MALDESVLLFLQICWSAWRGSWAAVVLLVEVAALA